MGSLTDLIVLLGFILGGFYEFLTGSLMVSCEFLVGVLSCVAYFSQKFIFKLFEFMLGHLPL